MYLWHILMVKPLAGLSILLCLATILSCVILERKRPHHRTDRFLIGFLGLLSAYQGMRILQGAGLMTRSANSKLDDAIELAVTVFYLLATVVLRLSTMDHLDSESAIRLARAAPPRAPSRNIEAERDLARLTWALPRLSDSAFRLYAYLCLRQEQANGRGAISSADVRLQLGKAKDELDRDLAELEGSGAVNVLRDGANVGITIISQPGAGAVQPVSDPVVRETLLGSRT